MTGAGVSTCGCAIFFLLSCMEFSGSFQPICMDEGGTNRLKQQDEAGVETKDALI